MSSGFPPGGQNPPIGSTQPAGRLPIKLRMQVGSSIGQVYTMVGDLLTIGRAQDNDVVLDDPQVSRYHAHLMRHGDEIIIEDLGSTNGTLVNGRRIAGPHVLQPSETIAVGASVFSVEGFAAPSTVGMLPQTLTARDFPGAARQSPAAPQQPAVPVAQTGGETPWQAIGWLAGLLIVVMLILALAGLTAWLLTRNRAQTPASIPSVFIQTPVTGSQVPTNQPVIVNATASDPNGVTRAELWVGGNVVDQQQSAAAEGQPTFPVSLRWTPTVPGNYTLEVRAYNKLDASSAPTTVMITVVGAQAAATATPTAAQPAATATPVGPPSALTTADLNVREGPGQNYPVMALVTAGTELEVTGRSPDSVWWQVVYPPGTGGRGWIYAPFTRPANTQAVPVVETPVPPTPTPTPPDTPTATPPPTGTPKPPTPTRTPTPTQGPVVEFGASRTTINDGECTTLQWHIERVQAAYLNGGGFSNLGITGPLGSRDVCPGGTTTYVLHADSTSGAIERSVTITVQLSGSEHTVALNAVASGTVREDGHVSTPSTSAGDDSSNRALRAFIAFDLSSLHDADILEARLDLSDYSTHGHPFEGLDSLIVEDVDWGSTLSSGDYDTSAAAKLKTIDDTGGLDDSINVTGRVADRLDEGKTSFRIRLRFEKNSDDDGAEDRISWNSARLTVRYR
jgi:uncharacterized protein YraI